MKYLIAHRGLNDHKYKENTIDAFLNSVNKDYISGIEVDIRLTKDNQIIMYHNTIYNNKLISKTLHKELNIELFENLLKVLKTNKIILIDIKCENNNYQIFIDILLKLINKYPLNYYLCSFNSELINYLKDKTNYPLGLFITKIINKNKDYDGLSFLALSKNSYDDIKYPLKFVWTINNNEKIYKYNYIITDVAYLLK